MTVAERSPSPAAAFAWPLTLAVATVAGSLAIVCVMPFVALAVVVAATMPVRRAVVTIGAIWFANQAIGFGFQGFPVTLYALGWGAALGVGTLAAFAVARAILGGSPDFVFGRMIAALVIGFAAYEGLLFVFASVVGGLETFTPAVVLQLASNEAAWFAGLVALRLALTGAAPQVFGRPVQLRLA